jgi:hypothetical protein
MNPRRRSLLIGMSTFYGTAFAPSLAFGYSVGFGALAASASVFPLAWLAAGRRSPVPPDPPPPD